MKRKIRRALRIAYDVANVTTGYAVFKAQKRTPEWAYQAMIRLFVRTTGASNDILSRGIGLVRRPYRIPSAPGVLPEISAELAAQADNQLKERGYFIFPFRLSEELCQQLEAIGRRADCMARLPSGELRSLKFDPQNPVAVKYSVPTETLINEPAVQRFLSDPSLLRIAQAYVGSAPIIDTVNMWWSTSINDEPDTEAAQYFHFDMDKIRWLKFFFYLTDVTPETGPHCFVAGSHRTGCMPENLLSKGYVRHRDEDLKPFYAESDFMEFTGPRGTILAEDTRGFHKGKPLRRGHRLIFELEFSNSLFGSYHAKPKLRALADPQFQSQLCKWPRLYSQFERVGEGSPRAPGPAPRSPFGAR